MVGLLHALAKFSSTSHMECPVVPCDCGGRLGFAFMFFFLFFLFGGGDLTGVVSLLVWMRRCVVVWSFIAGVETPPLPRHNLIARNLHATTAALHAQGVDPIEQTLQQTENFVPSRSRKHRRAEVDEDDVRGHGLLCYCSTATHDWPH